MSDPDQQPLRDVPTPRSEQVSGDPGVRVSDRAELLSAWAASADGADELDLALALLVESGLPAAETASRRAGIAYARGDLAACVGALAEIEADVVPTDGPRQMEHVVALGARASGGNPAAFASLVRLGATMNGGGRPWYLYILALAAERAGHLGVADEAWRALLVDHGVQTPLVLSRFLTGWIAGRDKNDANAALARVMSAAHDLRAARPRPWDDPSATERTVEALTLRGDGAGAALLVAAVARTSPPSARLAALAARTRPRSLKAPLLIPYLLPLLLAPAGILGIAAGLYLVRQIRQQWRVMPSLPWVDEKAWLSLERLQYSPRKQRTTQGTQLRGLVVLSVLLGFIAGVTLVTSLGGAVAGVWPSMPDVVGIGLVLLVVVGMPVLGGLAGSRLVRHQDLRALRRKEMEEDRVHLQGAAHCRCWETGGLVGPFAAAYAAVHLRPSVDSPLAGPPAGRAATALECPLSGVRWLVTTTDSGFSALLLRGTPRPVPTDAGALPVGTGGYL